MRPLPVSATKTLPLPSAATPQGWPNWPLPGPPKAATNAPQTAAPATPGAAEKISAIAARRNRLSIVGPPITLASCAGRLARGLVAHREQASREYEQAETEEVDGHEHG